MPTEKKIEAVKEIEDAISKSTVIVLADYRGLTAPQMTTLRRRLRASNAEIRIVKNTLARIAAANAGKATLAQSFRGTTAITLGYGEATAPVKTLVAYQTEAEALKIKGGLLEDRLYSAESIVALATLPPREVLLAQLLGQMAAPISLLVGTLASPIRGLAYILQARIKQLEEK